MLQILMLRQVQNGATRSCLPLLSSQANEDAVLDLRRENSHLQKCAAHRISNRLGACVVMWHKTLDFICWTSGVIGEISRRSIQGHFSSFNEESASFLLQSP
jgi:hypothetical protein